MSLGTLTPMKAPWGTAARDVDRLFDEFWSGFRRPAVAGARPERFVPRIDLEESKDEYRLTAELPGLEEKDFEVVIEDGVLTLKGEKHHEKTEEDEARGYRRVERVSGAFERRIRFGHAISADDVKASYKNGVLSVVLPKPEDAKSKVREIPVETA